MSAEHSFVIPTFDVCLCVSVDDPANPGEIKWVPCSSETISIQANGDANKVPTVEGFKLKGCFAYCYKAISGKEESWEIYDAFNIRSAMYPVCPEPSFLHGAKRGYGHYVATDKFNMIRLSGSTSFFVVKMEFTRNQAANEAEVKGDDDNDTAIVSKSQSASRYVQKYAVNLGYKKHPVSKFSQKRRPFKKDFKKKEQSSAEQSQAEQHEAPAAQTAEVEEEKEDEVVQENTGNDDPVEPNDTQDAPETIPSSDAEEKI